MYWYNVLTDVTYWMHSLTIFKISMLMPFLTKLFLIWHFPEISCLKKAFILIVVWCFSYIFIFILKTQTFQGKHPDWGFKDFICRGDCRTETRTWQSWTTAGDGEDGWGSRKEKEHCPSGTTERQGAQTGPNDSQRHCREPCKHPQILSNAFPLTALHHRLPLRVLFWVSVGGESLKCIWYNEV